MNNVIIGEPSLLRDHLLIRLQEETPKIFFKYFYVNTTTGEKSGEVLLEGKFTPEAMAAAEVETEGEE